MNLLFRLDSIRAERYMQEVVKELQINIQIMFDKPSRFEDNVRIPFLIKIEYSPPIASMDIRGAVIVMVKSSEEVLKSLNEGRIPHQIVMATYGYVLPIISLLSRELGLPPPCPPPAYTTSQTKERKSIGYHL